MFPAQTSLIPVTIALTRFLETYGLTAFFGNYPFWYLGVPYRYLTGPIIPLAFTLTHKLFYNVSLFNISIYLVLLSFAFGAVAWGILAQKISRERTVGIIVFLSVLIFPWRYLSSLTLGEASLVISKNLLPFVLIFSREFLVKKEKRRGAVAIIATTLLILINTSILPILLVGIVSLVLALSFNKGKVRKIEKYIKPTLTVLLGGLVVATLWYGPNYWLVILTNPSIGGAAGIKVIFRISDLLRSGLPLFLAIVAVYFSERIKLRLAVFSLTWVFTFLFLSLFRFIGDPDFWQDWTIWFSELEVGVALLMSIVVSNMVRYRKEILKLKLKTISKLRFQNSIISIRRFVLLGVLLILPYVLSYYVYGLLGRTALVSKNIPPGISSLDRIAEIAGYDRVFLSGSTVFWAGSTNSPLFQVRGGRDTVATHAYWDHAAYQIREGENPELARGWLESLGVKYVLVHGPLSDEAYHDFKNLSKWSKVGTEIWERDGDVIIEVADTSFAWIVNLNKLREVKSPENGADLESLNSYLSVKKRLVETIWKNPNEILLKTGELMEDEGVVLAVTYNSRWKAEEDVLIKKDPVGNLLIIPENMKVSSIKIQYK